VEGPRKAAGSAVYRHAMFELGLLRVMIGMMVG